MLYTCLLQWPLDHTEVRRDSDVDLSVKRRCLFSYTETREDPPEEVVAGELSGDFVQGLLCAAQLFGNELAGAAVL